MTDDALMISFKTVVNAKILHAAPACSSAHHLINSDSKHSNGQMVQYQSIAQFISLNRYMPAIDTALELAVERLTVSKTDSTDS